jgi:hypothetical protein
MSYTTRDIYSYKCYFPDNTIIVQDDTIYDHTNSDYTKVVEFTLRNKINPTSKLRFSFELCANGAGETVYARWYKDGVAWGAERDVTGAAYAERNSDLIPVAELGTTFAVYSRIGSSTRVFTRNHRIEGFASIFEESYP